MLFIIGFLGGWLEGGWRLLIHLGVVLLGLLVIKHIGLCNKLCMTDNKINGIIIQTLEVLSLCCCLAWLDKNSLWAG